MNRRNNSVFYDAAVIVVITAALTVYLVLNEKQRDFADLFRFQLANPSARVYVYYRSVNKSMPLNRQLPTDEFDVLANPSSADVDAIV